MGLSLNKKNLISIQLDATELSPAQLRLIKSLNTIVGHVLTTDDESEFFEGSAECMRLCASLIKQANFASALKDQDGIPYAEQALEYSVDVLQESIEGSRVVCYDN